MIPAAGIATQFGVDLLKSALTGAISARSFSCPDVDLRCPDVQLVCPPTEAGLIVAVAGTVAGVAFGTGLLIGLCVGRGLRAARPAFGGAWARNVSTRA